METVSGTVKAFNISPKGTYESVLVDSSGKIVQVNFPKDAKDAAKSYRVGAACKMSVKKAKGDKPSDHPVYDLADAANDGPQEGTVASINYARHGEPNGVVLDSGIFVHMKPDGAAKVKTAVGKKITFEGKSATSPDGHTVVEAVRVNGMDLKAKPGK